MARQKLPENKKRSSGVHVRLTKGERRKVEQAAKPRRVSSWARERLLA
jgi:hypothetical protein